MSHLWRFINSMDFLTACSQAKSCLICIPYTRSKICHSSVAFNKANFLEEGFASWEPILQCLGIGSASSGFLSLKEGHRPRKCSHQSFPGRELVKGDTFLCSCKNVEITSVTNSLVSPYPNSCSTWQEITWVKTEGLPAPALPTLPVHACYV